MAEELARISICICTSGRPAELERCLESIAAGDQLPSEVIVSNDSADAATAETVIDISNRYQFVRYVAGPRRGLCANRNHVIRQALGSHVSLLDDDAVVDANFVEHVTVLANARPRLIFTGDVLEDGTCRTSPTNPTFLGHFGRPVGRGDSLRNINLNCNLFPSAALEQASFDESIQWGYEDTDLCAQLLARGWHIAYAPLLVNKHLPPKRSDICRKSVNDSAEESRILVRIKYFRRQQRPFAAAAWSVLSALHLGIFAIQHRRFDILRAWLRGVALGWRSVV